MALTDEEKERLNQLIDRNEARAGRPSSYRAEQGHLQDGLRQSCEHMDGGCLVCFLARNSAK